MVNPLVLDRAFYQFPDQPVPIIDIQGAALEWTGFATLAGPSGSGKTTFFRLLCGWFDDSRSVCQFSPEINRHRQIRFVGAHDSLFPWRSAVGNLRYYGFSLERAVDELAALGLQEGINAPVGNLSFGMYKRVELAVAVSAGPELLLLDEFFSSIDDPTKGIIRDYLNHRRGERRTWIVAHEEPLRRWLTRNQYSLDIDQQRRCVTGFSRVS